MKVQHLTLGGNSQTRDTADILPTTRKALKILSLDYESQTVSIPDFPFRVKITATPEGAAFDLIREDQPTVMNLCCFDRTNRDEILDLVRNFAEQIPIFNINQVVTPTKKRWLYSIIVNPFLSPDFLPLAGETELYIYNELYYARKNI